MNTAKLDYDKENRAPRGMGQNETKKSKGGTPGRPKRKGNQFFDVGKVGRKTGITLADKGVRDENGLESMSHIFSSPSSPQRTFNSSDVNMQETSTMLTLPSPGSGPDVDKTLHSRKTPRLPPPRTSTPKHANIQGSPRRSTGRPISERVSMGMEGDRTRTQPPPNRVLDFGEGDVRKSIESPSPFKPRHTLRRSMAAQQENPFANGSPVRTVKPRSTILEGDDLEEPEQPPPADDGPLMMEDDDYYDAVPQQQDEEELPEQITYDEPAKRKPGRPRKSGSSVNSSQIQNTPPAANMTAGRKRTRASLNEQDASNASVSNSQISESGRASKRGRTSREKVIVHQDEEDVAVDPSMIAHGDEYVAELPEESSDPPNNGRGRGKKGKGKAKVPKERDANRAMGTKVRINDSPSKLRQNYSRESRESSRGLSVGLVSNVHLRASTPFEDAGSRTSRFGRALIQPLKYWANEMRIYKNGETAGIVRADEVSPPKRKKPPKKRGRKKQLDDIDELSETESVMADEWEEEMGVIAGMVANWDPETQMGLCEPEDLVREDLAFAQSSIVTRDVAGSEFKYAKIMTLPFFGSGVVELPPEGFKRAKNSSKMQMCFFVHEGKVLVEVGPATGGEMNTFAISRGGVWVVPRGNKYAITNESRTKTARLFFAQGCELEAMQMAEEA